MNKLVGLEWLHNLIMGVLLIRIFLSYSYRIVTRTCPFLLKMNIFLFSLC